MESPPARLFAAAVITGVMSTPAAESEPTDNVKVSLATVMFAVPVSGIC